VLNARFFEELRTKQQLGYIVQMTWSEHEGFLAIVCVVQTEFPPEFVRARIDAFLSEHLAWIETSLEESEFIRQRDGLVSNLSAKPKNLGEEFGRYWGEISKRRCDFEYQERKRALVEATSLEDLRKFVRCCLASAPRLDIEIRSTAGSPEKCPPDDAASEPPGPMPDRIWDGAAAAAEFRRGATWVPLS